MSHYTITPEQKQQWIDALESGNYQHGREFLKQRIYKNDGTEPTESSHCCIGVLAETLEMKISSGGGSIVSPDGCLHSFNGRDEWYGPINDLIGAENIRELVEINDSRFTKGFDLQIQYIKDKV